MKLILIYNKLSALTYIGESNYGDTALHTFPQQTKAWWRNA
jgi:hypothetical protein